MITSDISWDSNTEYLVKRAYKRMQIIHKLVEYKVPIKDLILISGFNVYPSEIEEVIDAHPAVKRSGVISIPSMKTGEAVKAFIIKNDPQLTKEEVITHCRQFLAAYKVPHEIEFVDKLPMSIIGKTLRRHLRETDKLPFEK